jgi:hypothetical protein
MVGDTGNGHPFFNTAITVNIKMPAVTGLALRMNQLLTPYPRRGQIGQFCTMYDHQLDDVGATTVQALYIRQWARLNGSDH